jgi:hypothetical protein
LIFLLSTSRRRQVTKATISFSSSGIRKYPPLLALLALQKSSILANLKPTIHSEYNLYKASLLTTLFKILATLVSDKINLPSIMSLQALKKATIFCFSSSVNFINLLLHTILF